MYLTPQIHTELQRKRLDFLSFALPGKKLLSPAVTRLAKLPALDGTEQPELWVSLQDLAEAQG